MTDLRIIPAEPFAAARDRYRKLATEDRPGDPWAVPFDAREGQTARPILWSVIAGLFFLILLIGAVS